MPTKKVGVVDVIAGQVPWHVGRSLRSLLFDQGIPIRLWLQQQAERYLDQHSPGWRLRRR